MDNFHLRLILFLLIFTSFWNSPLPRSFQAWGATQPQITAVESIEEEMAKKYQFFQKTCLENLWTVHSCQVRDHAAQVFETPLVHHFTRFSLNALKSFRQSELFCPAHNDNDKELTLGQGHLKNILDEMAKLSEAQKLPPCMRACLGLCAAKVMLKFSKSNFNTKSFLAGPSTILECGEGKCTEFAGLAHYFIQNLGVTTQVGVSHTQPFLALRRAYKAPFESLANFMFLTSSAPFIGHEFVKVKIDDKWFALEPLEGLNPILKNCNFYSEEKSTLISKKFHYPHSLIDEEADGVPIELEQSNYFIRSKEDFKQRTNRDFYIVKKDGFKRGVFEIHLEQEGQKKVYTLLDRGNGMFGLQIGDQFILESFNDLLRIFSK